MEPLCFGRQGSRTAARLGLVLLMTSLAACAGGQRSPVCAGQDALRGALTAVASAESASASGDLATVGRQMDEVERLVRVARSRLAGAAANTSTGAAARAMLEAANYVEFMVGQFRASGTVDFSLTQFASRELNRAVSGAGGTPLNC